MADRPCKPDADVKRLWRLLLPAVPFPACGVPADSAVATEPPVEPATGSRHDAEPDGKYR